MYKYKNPVSSVSTVVERLKRGGEVEAWWRG
jgi:P2-related tail formation protein